MGFEPHDLRVMSPTSYQTALPRDILFSVGRKETCRKPGSNRYVTLVTRDFKSRASANSATPAYGTASDACFCLSSTAYIVYHILHRLSIGIFSFFEISFIISLPFPKNPRANGSAAVRTNTAHTRQCRCRVRYVWRRPCRGTIQFQRLRRLILGMGKAHGQFSSL